MKCRAAWRKPVRSAAVTFGISSLVVAGCTGSPHTSDKSSKAPSNGGSLTFALPPASTPNWLFPIATAGHLAQYNFTVQAELYVPLYTFNGSSGKIALDDKMSAANAPSYSADGKSVTVTLKDLKWANGKAVTSRDVEFWLNLAKANKASWGNYSSGNLPDNVAHFVNLNDHSFRLELTHSVNPGWFTANQLSLITPMPQAAWDKESSSGGVGDYDRTPAGAKKVFQFMIGQAGQLSTYASNPLWKVTDGPFTISAFTTTGQVTLSKSTTYAGTDPAHLSSVTLVPFTSAAAEFNVLRAGGVDYGYIPTSDLGQSRVMDAKGYQVAPWPGWAINYMPYNFNNPKLGAAFKQLYIRQAIQQSIDQPTIIKVIWSGKAGPDYGPVPQAPPSDYLSSTQANNPYPFNPSSAKHLIVAHGWTIGSNGVATCTSAGTSPTQCGPGVAPGSALRVSVLAMSGSNEATALMQELQSSLSKIGIALDVKYEPQNSVLNDSPPCKSTKASCSWQLSFFGAQGSWYFTAYPSGEQIFQTGAGTNLGSYSDSSADSLINASINTTNSTALQSYSAYLAKNLPVVWLPMPAYQVSAIRKSVKGVVQDPLAGMQIQRWYISK